jgi:hypothetical protein
VNEVLVSAYPNHNWQAWKFSAVPEGYWDSPTNQREFFDWIASTLQIYRLDDWYNYSMAQVEHAAPAGTPRTALCIAF